MKVNPVKYYLPILLIVVITILLIWCGIPVERYANDIFRIGSIHDNSTSLARINHNPAGITSAENFTYVNILTTVNDPEPILSTYPEFFAPIIGEKRYVSNILVEDDNATLAIRAWRYSYNARGIIEVPSLLNGNNTVIIVVHPWAIDDGTGIRTPEPAGAAFFATPEKNAIYLRHASLVLNPFLNKMRPHVAFIGFSLPGNEDAIRKELFQSPRTALSDTDRQSGTDNLQAVLSSFDYRGHDLPGNLTLNKITTVSSYLSSFPGIGSAADYNPLGFWDLPITVCKTVSVDANDVVFYDEHGYDELRRYLNGRGIRHILLAGYATDMCLKATTAGYENLKKDFNVYIVGDATMATFPAQENPRAASSVALASTSLDNLITESSWIRIIER
jgi:hypothetical protein